MRARFLPALLWLAACELTVPLNRAPRPDAAAADLRLPEDLPPLSALDFTLRTGAPLGASPGALAVGDFDGDGRPDVAVSLPEAGRIGIFYGTADGALQEGRDRIAVPAGSLALASGDFNRDGLADLAIASPGDAQVLVALAGTGRSFRPPRAYPVGAGPARLAVADLDRNGYADIAVAAQADNQVSVLLSRAGGAGELGTGDVAALGYAVPDGPIDLAAGDIGGPGDADIDLLPASSGTVALLKNRGNGTFTLTDSYYPLGDQVAIALPVLRHGALPDLASLSAGAERIVVLRNLNGRFEGKFMESAAVGKRPRALLAADLNRDGLSDLVTANAGDGQVSVLLAKPSGALDPAQGFRAGQEPWAVAAADLDGDGRTDLLVVDHGAGTLNVLRNTSR